MGNFIRISIRKMCSDSVYWKIPVPVVEPNLYPSLSAAQTQTIPTEPKMDAIKKEQADSPCGPKAEPTVEEANLLLKPETNREEQNIIPVERNSEAVDKMEKPFESNISQKLDGAKTCSEAELVQIDDKIQVVGGSDINALFRNDSVNSMSMRWLAVLNNNDPEIPHDVTFFVGAAAEKISCHKIVLCVASPIFKSMFDGKTSTTNEIYISESDPAAFRSMITYAYSGKLSDKVHFSEGDLISLIHVTHKFSIPEVWKTCSQILEKRLCLNNAVKIYKVAETLQIVCLKKKAEAFIVGNFSEILNSEFFYDFTSEDLFKFLQSDHLIVHSEKDLFSALLRWAKFQCNRENVEESPENLRNILGQLIYQIHYSTMTAVEFFSIVDGTNNIFNADESILLLKHIILPEGDRENMAPPQLGGQYHPLLVKPVREITKQVNILNKEQFSSLGNRRFNRDIYYSDGIELLKLDQRYYLKSIGFVIKSKPDAAITFHIKIICGIGPEQEVVREKVASLKTGGSEVTHVVFEDPVKLVEGKKYTILFSPKQGQLLALMSKEKLPLSIVCDDPSKSISLKFFRECGVIAVLRFIYI